MRLKDKELPAAVTSTEIPLWPKRSGKVRDVYDTGEHLLIVATDRISAYDSVLANGIPCKGRVLTSLSLFWFNFLKDIAPNHLVTSDPVAADERLAEYSAILSGRSMLVKKARVLPVECIVRGYLSGSGWRSYRKTGAVCGMNLPAGLVESDKLNEVLFTPTTKAEEGHDEDISFAETVNQIGREAAETIRDRSIEAYSKASRYARTRGIIIADTKFEFGVIDGEIRLIDEVLTPDSSRFWPADDYEPGRGQKAFDKQYVRDYLDKSGWDHRPPAPALPEEVIVRTLERYIEAYEQLSGETFEI